jgi:hypothetical protein
MVTERGDLVAADASHVRHAPGCELDLTGSTGTRGYTPPRGPRGERGRAVQRRVHAGPIPHVPVHREGAESARGHVRDPRRDAGERR